MNLQNALYVLAVVAIAIAAYFTIEMKMIDVESDSDTTEVMAENPASHSGDDMMDEEMMDEEASTSEDMMDDMDASSTDENMMDGEDMMDEVN